MYILECLVLYGLYIFSFDYITDTNIALDKPVTMSSKIVAGSTQENPASAVDGAISTDIDNCGCCTSTRYNDLDPWLTVDLQQEYQVDIVIVRGRIDNDASDSEYYTNIQTLIVKLSF